LRGWTIFAMKISVITVTWNSAATIMDTLRSVNAQTHRDVEHIVIDGGSTDATLAIVRAEGRRVAAIVSEPDQGIYDAMNKGLRLATGDVVGLINSDDFFASPEVLATVAAAFADPDVDAVYGDLCYVSQSDPSQVVRYWRSSPFAPGLFARGWAPPHPTLYIRRAIYERLGGFDLAYPLAADLDLMARFLEVHRIRTRYVPKVFVRMRTGGATNRSWANVARQNREIWHALHKHGLAGSKAAFVLRKIASRLRQFTSRPEGR
jgi:glycosyltransferase involved in cell wall biosynthesis